MLLYHGSNSVIKIPDLTLSRRSLDFGTGFYTTVNRDQAIEFANKVTARKGYHNPTVSVYDVDITSVEAGLKILRFSSPNRDWLNFIHQNRKLVYNGENYDLVIGPVANDDVYATLLVYEQGILNIEQTIEALKVKNLYNQFVFKTKRSLLFLKYVNSFTPANTVGQELP